MNTIIRAISVHVKLTRRNTCHDCFRLDTNFLQQLLETLVLLCEGYPSISSTTPTILRMSIRQDLDQTKGKPLPVLVSMNDVPILDDDRQIIYPSPHSKNHTRKLHMPIPVSDNHHVKSVSLRIRIIVLHRGPHQLSVVGLDLLVVGSNHDISLQNHHIVDQREVIFILQLAWQRLSITRPHHCVPQKRRAARCPASP